MVHCGIVSSGKGWCIVGWWPAEWMVHCGIVSTAKDGAWWGS